MMIGNENRMTATGEDDETPVDDVISNKRLTVGKCKMWCGQWTGSYTASTKKCKQCIISYIHKNLKLHVFYET